MESGKQWWNQFDANEYKELVSDLGIDSSALTFDELGAEIALRALPSQEMHFKAGDTIWDRVRREFRLLLCEGSEKYKELRDSASKLGGQSATSLVAVISAALGTAIGVVSTVIAPLIALLLLAVARVGKEIFCTGAYLDEKLG